MSPGRWSSWMFGVWYVGGCSWAFQNGKGATRKPQSHWSRRKLGRMRWVWRKCCGIVFSCFLGGSGARLIESEVGRGCSFAWCSSVLIPNYWLGVGGWGCQKAVRGVWSLGVCWVCGIVIVGSGFCCGQCCCGCQVLVLNRRTMFGFGVMVVCTSIELYFITASMVQEV